jgi:predicted metalloendopeptidase
MGRLYDGGGNLVNWWSNATAEEFVNRSQCFVDQYSKFNMTGPGGKAYPVDGKVYIYIHPIYLSLTMFDS